MALYYDPKSIAPILAQGGQEQAKYLSQVTGAAGGLPALGGVAQAGFDASAARAKRRSLLEAQQGYAQYLAKVDAGIATPQDHEIGRMYGMSLGIEQKPSESPDPRLMSYFQKKAGIEGDPIRGSKSNIGMAETIAKMEKPSNPMSGMSPTQEQIDMVARDFASGAIPSKEFGAMIGRSSPADRYRLYQAVKKYNPDFKMDKSMLSYKKEESSAGATGRVQGGKGTEVASAVGSLHDTIGFARPYVMKLNNSDIPALNEAFQKGLVAIEGNPDATALLVHMNEMRGQYAQIIHGGGTPTDQDYSEATKVLRGGLNPAGFDAMSEAVVKAGRSRAGRLTGRISNEDVFSAPKGSSPESDPLGIFK